MVEKIYDQADVVTLVDQDRARHKSRSFSITGWSLVRGRRQLYRRTQRAQYVRAQDGTAIKDCSNS